jgi:predicted Zn-dependent protease
MDLAARSWEQVLLAEPNNPEALAGLARYTKMNGRKAEADRYLERLRSVDPQNAAIGSINAMRSLDQQKASLDDAQRLAEKKDFDSAFRIYRQVFGNEPPPGSWAVSYYETQAATPGGWNDATAALRRLLTKYPGSPDYALALGKLLTYRPKTRAEGMQILESVKGNAVTVESARAAWRQALVWDAGNLSSLPSLRAYLARYPDSELSKLMSGKEKPLPAAPQPVQILVAPPESETSRTPRSSKMKEVAQDSSSTTKPVRRGSGDLGRLAFIRMKEQDFASAITLFERAIAEEPQNETISEGLATARFWNYMKQGSDDLAASRAPEACEKFKAALALRPQSPEALRALAGSYEMQGQPSSAVPLYLQLTRSASAPSDDWFGLIRSQYNAGDGRSALRSLNQVPLSIQESWGRQAERAILLAFVHLEGGDDEAAHRLAERVQQLATDGAGNFSNAAHMQLAGLYMRLRDPSRAATLYQEAIRNEPGSTEGWAGIINALSQDGKAEQADLVLERMPAQAYQDASKRPEFLQAMAKLEMAQARYDRAEVYLRKAAEIEAESGRKTEPGMQLQLAEIWTRTGKLSEAEQLLRRVTVEQPDSAPAWQSLISLLHTQKKDKAAMEALQSIPEKTYLALRGDYAFAAVEAGVYMAADSYDEALKVVRSASARAQKTGTTVPLDFRIQEAWILLNSRSNERELYALLNTIPGSGLSQTQQKDIDSIWSIWSQRRAAAALDRGDLGGALKILRTAAKLFPANSKISGSLAGAYLQAGDTRDAFLVYRTWGLKDATADDFNGAVGSAMAAHDNDAAQRWLDRGLHKFPRDPRLLSLAGKRAAQRGDYDRAKLYFREALASLPPDGARESETLEDPGQDSTTKTRQALGSLLAGSDIVDDDAVGPESQTFASAREPELPRDSGKSTLETHNLPPLPKISGAAYFLDPASTATKTPESSLHEQITSDLGAIGARNSPYFTNGAILQGRTGQGGVDKLLVEEANLEASTTIGDRIRLSIIAKPTYLDSGSPDAAHELGFGSLEANGTSSTRTAFGVGVEGQISTRDFGLRLGMSPNDFLVHNWIGGLRLRMGKSPFTILLNRDSVRDTKLSFAGERDANTNQVWGGVMAGSASILGNWGDDKSGFYTSAGYQDIRGKGVAPNTRIDLTMGAYFKVLTTKDGSLTAGLNFSGMHYEKNLRYFTLGQGGYFSPQQYFLTNIPVRWDGTWNRVLKYSVSGSLGVQHFQEDASRYFPLRQDKGGVYPALASTGGNYNLDFRMGYQLTPQWLAGAFATVGNARDYRNSSAGIFLRYLFQPRPFSADLAADSVPDWKGSQPFGLPLN